MANPESSTQKMAIMTVRKYVYMACQFVIKLSVILYEFKIDVKVLPGAV